MGQHRVAYFISPHGFGHAARAAAIMADLHRLVPDIHFDIYTKVPRWFFQDSLPAAFSYHSLLTDIGLVQKTPLQEDAAETARELDGLLPFEPRRISQLAQVIRSRSGLVICDIAPMGIAVAQAAGIKSVLVENFTWDWIYRGYVAGEPRLERPAAYLQSLFEAADYHVQTEPVCRYVPADLVTPPVSRRPRSSRAHTRKELGLSSRDRVVLITMGGIPGQYAFLDRLKRASGWRFIIPGASSSIRMEDNLVLLPHRSRFYHPDLVNAVDVVIAKLGYSTVAEVYASGVPIGYIPRARFRESDALAKYIQGHMVGREISEERFNRGAWIEDLEELAAHTKRSERPPAGARQVARFIRELL